MAPMPIPIPSRLEELALFRHAIVGDLVISDLPRGALNEELRQRAERRYRPPVSRTFHWKTLQRWLLATGSWEREVRPRFTLSTGLTCSVCFPDTLSRARAWPDRGSL